MRGTARYRIWWWGVGGITLLVVALLCLVILINVRLDLPIAALKQKYTGDASRFASIEGMNVHYRDEGSGPPLVLIHGTLSSLHTWDGWVAQLAPHRRVIRLDLPGFGLTGPAPDRDYRAAREARVVLTLLDRLSVGRADIAGNSFGGRVALMLALEHPERVGRLILIDSRGLNDGSGQTLVEQLSPIPLVNQLLRWVTPRALIRSAIEGIYYDRARVTDALVDRYHDLARREGNRQTLIDIANSPEEPDLDNRLAAIRAPVLLLWGASDSRVPVSIACRMRARIPGAALIVYPGAGHVPMEELPAPTATDAEAFLSNISVTARDAEAVRAYCAAQ